MSEDGMDRLEYGTDYTYRCKTCGGGTDCECGNPYYETILLTVEVPDPPKGVKNGCVVGTGVDRDE